MDARRPQWSKQTKLIISLMMVALVVFLVARFRIVIPPLMLACILAYVLSPFVGLLQKRTRLPRFLAIVITYLLLIGILVAIPILIIPILGAQVNELNLDFKRLLSQIELLLENQLTIFGQDIDLAMLTERAGSALQNFLEPFIGQTLGLLVDVISSIAWLIFILVISFYLVKDSARLKSWIEDHIPPAYKIDYALLRDEINQIWAAFFRGQLVLALVVGILITIAGFILGLPFALALGVLAGFLEFIPSLGHAIWEVIACTLAFFIGSTWMAVPNWVFMLIVLGLHWIFEQFDLNYLIPRIIGRRVHLPPVVVILGIVAGAVLAGVLGILIAAPTIASARVLGRYIYANLFDLDPFPQASTSPLPSPDPLWWQHAKNHNTQRII